MTILTKVVKNRPYVVLGILQVCKCQPGLLHFTPLRTFTNTRHTKHDFTTSSSNVGFGRIECAASMDWSNSRWGRLNIITSHGGGKLAKLKPLRTAAQLNLLYQAWLNQTNAFILLAISSNAPRWRSSLKVHGNFFSTFINNKGFNGKSVGIRLSLEARCSVVCTWNDFPSPNVSNISILWIIMQILIPESCRM